MYQVLLPQHFAASHSTADCVVTNCTITSVSCSTNNVLIQYICSSVEYRRLTVEHEAVLNLLRAPVNTYGSNSQSDTSVSCKSLI